jgi:formate-dependent nitrite reductase membrane component NrfD
MNLFVVDPVWGWWIVLYFFLGGIAAGAYFVATLMDWIGGPADRDLARVGYWLAFPLVLLCGLFLTVDLERPERFWHMLFKSEIVHQALAERWPWSAQGWRTMTGALLLKWWSPMSIGAWALSLFGACSFFSFLGSLRQEGRLVRWFRRSLFARSLQFLVAWEVGFFIAAYTGALVSATNQPIWSDSTWIAPLFLTSAASTGIAAMILVAWLRKGSSEAAITRLDRAAFLALVLEGVVFAIFLASLGGLLRPIFATTPGKLLILGTAVCGLIVPFGLQLAGNRFGGSKALTAAVFALVGGFILRYCILRTPPELLANTEAARSAEHRETAMPGSLLDRKLLAGFSPEDGRPAGSGPGADPGNKAGELVPRSKVFKHD